MKNLRQTRTQRFIARLIYCILTPFGVALLWFFYRLRVHGRENIPRQRGQGCLVISNHTLFQDPLVIGYALFPRRVVHSTIERNMQLPFVGKLIDLLGAFAIPKHQGWQTMAAPVIDRVNAGCFVHFFPEGKLKKFNQDIQRFRHGAFRLAIENNVPVLPITTVVRRVKIRGKKIYWLPPKVDVYISPLCSPASYHAVRPVYKQARTMARAMQDSMQQIIATHD